MKIFLKVIAWTGFGIFSLGTFIALMQTLSYHVQPPTPYGGGVDFGHTIAFVLAVIGIPLMLIGGLLARPRYFWLVSIVVSSLYVISFHFFIVNLVFEIRHTEWDYLIQTGWLYTLLWRNLGPFIPGIVGVAEGIIIWRIGVRKRQKLQRPEPPS
jgi:hypothetical protein